MNILVTGAQGFIGRHLLKMLASTDAEVHAADRNVPTGVEPSATWHHLDLFDSAEMRKLIAAVRPTHLIHLAWEARPGIFWSAPENLDWVAASVLLLRAFDEAGGTSFVSAGSSAERSDTTLYARSKTAFRVLGEQFCSDRDLRFATGRVFFPYGPTEPREKFASMLFERFRTGLHVELREPNRRLDFVHVDDVARAFIEINRSTESGTFEIGAGVAPTVHEFASLAASIAGCDPSECVRDVPGAKADADLVANIKRLSALGWAPRVPLIDGLRELFCSESSGAA